MRSLVCDGDSRKASSQKRLQGEKREVGAKEISLQEVVGLRVKHQDGRLLKQETDQEEVET